MIFALETIIKYLGVSAFEIRTPKANILIDPFIRNNPFSAVKIEEIKDIQLILVTHGAFDHLGNTLEIANSCDSTVIADPAVGHYLVQNGLNPEKLVTFVWGMDEIFHGLRVKCVETKHCSFILNGNQFISGTPLGFVVYTSNAVIYHPGDTSLFTDMKLIGDLYRPTVALIPVGAAPRADCYAELHPDEAAIAVSWLKPKIAVPMHYKPGSKEPEIFEKLCKLKCGDLTKVEIINPGEELNIP